MGSRSQTLTHSRRAVATSPSEEVVQLRLAGVEVSIPVSAVFMVVTNEGTTEITLTDDTVIKVPQRLNILRDFFK